MVQKPGETQLTVRARVAADLDRLRERYLPTLSATVANAGTDYPFRARASRKAFSEAMARMGEDIDYANFKNEVGKGRAEIYSGVWTRLLAGAPPGGNALPNHRDAARRRSAQTVVGKCDQVFRADGVAGAPRSAAFTDCVKTTARS